MKFLTSAVKFRSFLSALNKKSSETLICCCLHSPACEKIDTQKINTKNSSFLFVQRAQLPVQAFKILDLELQGTFTRDHGRGWGVSIYTLSVKKIHICIASWRCLRRGLSVWLFVRSMLPQVWTGRVCEAAMNYMTKEHGPRSQIVC